MELIQENECLFPLPLSGAITHLEPPTFAKKRPRAVYLSHVPRYGQRLPGIDRGGTRHNLPNLDRLRILCTCLKLECCGVYVLPRLLARKLVTPNLIGRLFHRNFRLPENKSFPSDITRSREGKWTRFRNCRLYNKHV